MSELEKIQPIDAEPVYVAATGDDEERDIILTQNRIIRQTNQVLWHGVH
jgi:hypothetical protein